MLFIQSHYEVKGIVKSMADVQRFFPGGRANELNWCFLSTSGVHGTYSTLDAAEEDLAQNEPASITVVIAQPRTCCLYYGHIDITAEDIPWLRSLVASTIEAVTASQKGNLPK